MMQNRMLLLATPKHPLARKRTVSVSDLEGQGFIGYEAGTPTRIMIDANFKGLGIQLEYIMNSSNIDTIKQLAIAGMGLTFLPEIAVEMELKQKMLKIVPLDDVQIERPVTVYWKERRVLPRPAQMILKFFQDWGKKPLSEETERLKRG
jgi:DNA-binding transcriptional LysR family regulator